MVQNRRGTHPLLQLLYGASVRSSRHLAGGMCAWRWGGDGGHASGVADVVRGRLGGSTTSPARSISATSSGVHHARSLTFLSTGARCQLRRNRYTAETGLTVRVLLELGEVLGAELALALTHCRLMGVGGCWTVGSGVGWGRDALGLEMVSVERPACLRSRCAAASASGKGRRRATGQAATKPGCRMADATPVGLMSPRLQCPMTARTCIYSCAHDGRNARRPQGDERRGGKERRDRGRRRWWSGDAWG